MLRKPVLYDRAVLLRKQGCSYGEILKLVPVGNGTISRWCRDIVLSDDQKERLLQNKRNSFLIKTLIKAARISRRTAHAWAKHKTKEIGFSTREDILLISGILLYWAEGNKYNETNHKEIGFTNTDYRMIKIMMAFFMKVANVPKGKIKIVVRMGREGNIQRAINYWSKITKLPIKNFNKPELLTLTPQSRSLIKYPNGMCRIMINDVLLSRKICYIISEFYRSFIINKILDPSL